MMKLWDWTYDKHVMVLMNYKEALCMRPGDRGDVLPCNDIPAMDIAVVGHPSLE